MPAIKRVLDNASDHATRKKKKPRNDDEALQPVNLAAEEVFKRGGGSLLTPLEKRRIEAQANKDVLFKQQPSRSNAAHDPFSSDDEQTTATKTGPVRKQRKLSERTKPLSAKTPGLKRQDNVRGLSFKRLVPGSLVLGRVAEITHKDIALSLPNNLTGYVQISSISDAFSAREEELEEKSKFEILSSVFHIGQMLRACVLSTADTGPSDLQKRRIELSIEPFQVNKNIQQKDLVRHSVVQAEIKDIEDHGVVVSLGLDQSTTTGFIPKKELNSQDPNAFEIGAVMLCAVTERPKSGNVVKLSIDEAKLDNITKSGFLRDAPSIDVIAPGVAIEFTVSDVTSTGLLGTALGFAKVAADIVHLGAWTKQKDAEDLFQIGSKHIGRVIWKLVEDGDPLIGVSLLDHLLHGGSSAPHSASPPSESGIGISAIMNDIKVLHVEPNLGLFMDFGNKQPRGFVHISRISSDEKVKQLSKDTGPYAVGTSQRCRIVGYNAMDMLFLLSMERNILDLPFLRLEDLQTGQLLKGSVESFVHAKDNVVGLLVKLTDSVSGLVTKLHLSDVVLEYPEKKFKPGTLVTCRVLSIDLPRRRLRLTLKKSLVNSDAPIWTSFGDVTSGVQVPGTLVSFVHGGAIIQFYGTLRGFLPLSQMSEAYLEDARDAFRLGQVISVKVLSSDPSQERLVLTCRDVGGLSADQQTALSVLEVGSIVEGTITEKSKDDIILRLTDSGILGRLAYGHLIDGSSHKVISASKRVRIGQTLKDLMILQKDAGRSSIRVTSKQSLKKAFLAEQMPRALEQLKVGMPVTGYINNTTLTSVFVSFGGDLTALLPKSRLYKSSERPEDVDVSRNATIDCRVVSIDLENRRFLLSRADEVPGIDEGNTHSKASTTARPKTGETQAYTIGDTTQATIVSKKETQLNVELSDGAQGRIDVSEAFNGWEDIKDRKYPLRQFHLRQQVTVRVLGVHDSKTHRFLPISHAGKSPVFELSLRSAGQTLGSYTELSIDKVQVGSQWLCFVNNVKEDCLWVNLSPNVRGRIDVLQLSDITTRLTNLETHFPVGSAIRATVTHVDAASNRLDLSAKSALIESPATIKDLTIGSVLPAKITKIQDKSLVVQLSDQLSAPISLVDLADDFSTVDLAAYHKNQVLRVSVVSLDPVQNRIRISARASRVFPNAPPALDKEINSISELQVNDVVRGFVKNASKNGVFISLGSGVDAFVHTRDLSDSFVKDWQTMYNQNEVVRGKILAVESQLNRVQMSLKQSVLDPNYKPPLTYNDVSVGDVFTGKVRKVQDFGAFIVLDGSANVSGLCHRTQMANETVNNAKDILEEGDPVTVTVSKIDVTSKKISLSLKSSHVRKQNQAKTTLPELTEDSEFDVEDLAMTTSLDDNTEMVSAADQRGLEDGSALLATGPGLMAGSFDWSGNALKENGDAGFESDSAVSIQASRPKKRKKGEVPEDLTAELDANHPQSIADFERLLLGQPNSSNLWLSYMAHQLEHGEIEKARAVAERAVKTINHQSRDSAADAMDAWIGYLNLEILHGDAEAVDAVFERACEVNDAQEIQTRLAKIYIMSGDFEVSPLQSACSAISMNPY